MSAIEHRYFFALQPSPMCRGIARQRDQLGPAEHLVSDTRLHATLAITDDFKRPCPLLESALHSIGGSIAAAPIPMRLDQLSGSNGSIALRSSRRCLPLAALAGPLQRRMARAGFLRTEWVFCPHVTLLYRAGVPFTRAIDPICWTANDFVLIHSIIGEHQHIELGRWPLVERQGSLAF